MAYRIDDSVVRGEVDNRVKGIVRGKIWLEQRPEPLVLELEGNAAPDLAGCLLTFTNPHQRFFYSYLNALQTVQRGWVGEMTASRKVRVPKLPPSEISTQQEHPLEQILNSLCLEWF